MVILLYGPDSYRRLQKQKKIIEIYRQKNPAAAWERFDLNGLLRDESFQEFLRLKEFAGSRPIFSDKKLAVLENVWNTGANSRRKSPALAPSNLANKELKKFLESELSSADLTLIISEESSPPANLNFLLKKAATREEFRHLSGQKLKLFIEKEAEERGLKLSPGALDFLSEQFKGNTWGLVTELEKLHWLAAQDKSRPLGLKEIAAAGDYPESENLFSFINLFGYRGQLSRKLAALEKLFFSREEPAKIFNILASRGHHPPEFLERLADYDVAVKSGRMDYEEVLLDLVLL